MKKSIYALTISFISNCICWAQEIDRGSCSSGSVTASYNVSEFHNLCKEDPWILVFEDNFDGNGLDTNRWHIVIGVPRDPYFQKQKAWHTNSNILVGNGILKIISRRDTFYNMPVIESWNPYVVSYSDFFFSTGEIMSKNKFGYGKYEARIRIPKGKGLWPAFWTYGNTDISPWHEIDVFEFYGETESEESSIHHMAVHRDYMGQGHKQCNYNYTGYDFSSDFHTFTVIYTQSYIKWLLDGELKQVHHRYMDVAGYYQDCDLYMNQVYYQNLVFPTEAMNIIMNVAVSNKDDERPDMTTPFPAIMEVDWVRYYVTGDCNDITVSDTNRFYDFNSGVIIGKNVTVENMFLFGNREKQIIADNSITLKPETSITGVDFTAKIETPVCLDKVEKKSLAGAHSTIEDSLKDFQSSSVGFGIFPNPVKKTISVIHDCNPRGEYSISVFNVLGTKMQSHHFWGSEYTFGFPFESGDYMISLQDESGRILGIKK